MPVEAGVLVEAPPRVLVEPSSLDMDPQDTSQWLAGIAYAWNAAALLGRLSEPDAPSLRSTSPSVRFSKQSPAWVEVHGMFDVPAVCAVTYGVFRYLLNHRHDIARFIPDLVFDWYSAWNDVQKIRAETVSRSFAGGGDTIEPVSGLKRDPLERTADRIAPPLNWSPGAPQGSWLPAGRTLLPNNLGRVPAEPGMPIRGQFFDTRGLYMVVDVAVATAYWAERAIDPGGVLRVSAEGLGSDWQPPN